MKSVPRPTAGIKSFDINACCGLLGSCVPAASPVGRSEEHRPSFCTRVLVRQGKSLYKFGEPIRSIYTIISGTFKACAVTQKGDEQVMGFYMRGAILGLDAMANGRYAASAIAMEDSRVCMISAQCLEQHCAQDKSVAKRIYAALAREIDARHRMILTLGRKTAEERVASFLMELAATYLALGYSTSDINMVMKREEIGSYLGISLETVSRILSSFHDRQLLAVNQKHVCILDIRKLARLTGESIGMFRTPLAIRSTARN